MSNDHEKDALVDRARVAEARLKLAEELIQKSGQPNCVDSDVIAEAIRLFWPQHPVAVTDERDSRHQAEIDRWRLFSEQHYTAWGAMRAERDAAVIARDYWHDMHRHLRSSFDDVNAKLMDTRRQVTGLEAELVLTRGIIAALTIPQAPPGDVTTARKPNPFRSFDGDRRRVGG